MFSVKEDGPPTAGARVSGTGSICVNRHFFHDNLPRAARSTLKNQEIFEELPLTECSSNAQRPEPVYRSSQLKLAGHSQISRMHPVKRRHRIETFTLNLFVQPVDTVD